MNPKRKRIVALLLLAVMLVTLVSSVAAATDQGAAPSPEPDEEIQASAAEEPAEPSTPEPSEEAEPAEESESAQAEDSAPPEETAGDDDVPRSNDGETLTRDEDLLAKADTALPSGGPRKARSALAAAAASSTGTVSKSTCVNFSGYTSPYWYCNRYYSEGSHVCGHYFYAATIAYHTVDGVDAYCIEPNTSSIDGATYSSYTADSASSTSYWMRELDSTQRSYIQQILAFGYPSIDRGYSRQVQYAATQVLIWEVVAKLRYADVSVDAEIPAAHGPLGFLANWFGVVFRNSPEEQAYEAALEQHAQYERERLILEGKAYPDRLFPIPEVEMRSRQAVELRPLRHYSIWSLLMIFFGFSVFGWIWEVGLHLIETGELVNRGILHGPWLPIYGSGVVMILILLNPFRSRPGLEFGLTVVLCGVVEYFTSYVMEITHNGMRWWDYSGYFLNINGRICAEGLLVFGIGGCLAVYVLAPLTDNLLRRLNTKRVAAVSCALLCVFLCDQIYSGQQPNTGSGVTDTAAVEPSADLLMR